jgi:hypothetical protein
MRGAQLFEMVEKQGQPFYLIELKLYLISKSRAKALDLREERGAGISQRRGPLGRRIFIFVFKLLSIFVLSLRESRRPGLRVRCLFFLSVYAFAFVRFILQQNKKTTTKQ